MHKPAKELLKDHMSPTRKKSYWGLYCFLLIAALCWLVPFFSSHNIQETNLAKGAQAPSLEHWFGTDDLGRDLFIRTLAGGQVSIGVGLAATLVALMIGLPYGLIAGYYAGRIDSLMMRLVDVLYALPFTIIVILLTTLLGRSIALLFIAIGAVEWLTMARIVRAQTSAIRQNTYISAARTAGLPHRQIIRQHIFPNCNGTVIVYSVLTIPAVILLESTLSFLGLGIQPPASSWGALISEGAKKLDVYPWQILFPTALFSLTLFALNQLGENLRAHYDVNT
jgi:oligopeptide transport system permease protein